MNRDSTKSIDFELEIESSETEIESNKIDACVFLSNSKYIATYSEQGESECGIR